MTPEETLKELRLLEQPLPFWGKRDMEPAFTKAELREMWKRPPDRQQNIVASKIVEALKLSDNDIVLAFSGGKDSSYLAYRLCQIASGMGVKHLRFMFADTTNESRNMYKHIESFLPWLEKQFNISIELTVTRPAHHDTWISVIRREGIPFPTKRVAMQVRKIRRELIRLGIRMQDIEQYGRPTIECRDTLRKMGFNNTVVLYMTGWSNKSQKFIKSFKMAKQWYPLCWEECPVPVSERCCEILKEGPLDKLKYPNTMTAEIAAESAAREQSYLNTGCNAKLPDGHIKSRPMGSMTEQGVLYGIKYFGIPMCADYGDIIEKDGELKHSRCKRTGCSLCGFAAKWDTTRFIRLAEDEPAKARIAFMPMNEGGLGYRELIEFSNRHCKTKIEIPDIMLHKS